MRDLDSTLSANLGAGQIFNVILAMLTFKSSTQYVWSGAGTLEWDAQAYTGVGSMGKLGAIRETTTLRADGTTVSLSGIDPALKAACLTDIKIGAPAKIWYGNFLNGALVGAPYLVYSGQVDKPTFNIDTGELMISLALENKLINHARPSNVRYTSADQHIKYPDDTAFKHVEELSDQALFWID